MKKQVIAHLDMDSFYASVEIRDDISLIGKPVIIGSDPMGGKGRGVVSTCSYEARQYGLHSGMPISQAWARCPNGVYIKPSGKYGTVSARIMNILCEYADEIEQVSIDEAYLNLSFCNSFYHAANLAQEIKKAILAREGLTCSIGIAPARTYAKIASDLQKPAGLVILTPDNLMSTLNELPVSKIPGVGKKTTVMLKEQNINSIADLADANIQLLQDIFGKYAVRIRMIATGQDSQALREQGPQQSIGRETTFNSDTSDLMVIYATFEALTASLGAELMRKQARYKTIGIRIRYSGFITLTRAVSGTHADYNEALILRTALKLFNEYWTGDPVRLIGIRLSGLVYQDPVQSSLENFFPL